MLKSPIKYANYGIWHVDADDDDNEDDEIYCTLYV